MHLRRLAHVEDSIGHYHTNFALSCRFAVDNSNELGGGGLSNVVGQEGVDPKLNQHLTLCV